MTRSLSLGLICTQVAISLLADIYLKQGRFWLGVILYGLCAIPAYYMFKITLFGSAWILWSVVGVLLGVSIAKAYYHEPLTWRRLASVCLALIVIYLGGE